MKPKTKMWLALAVLVFFAWMAYGSNVIAQADATSGADDSGE
jgi:hypothetical protein